MIGRKVNLYPKTSSFVFFAVSLTKTDKKGLANKQSIIEEIQQAVEKYESIYIFYIQNMRNNKLKEIRTEWKNSRFFFGKNRVMRLGLRNVDVDSNDDDEEQSDLQKVIHNH
jgi:mRNA turnover protein 4